jgi:hypothetical protein
MRNINIKIEDERYDDLTFIQNYYSKRNGTKITQAQTLRILFFETANRIKHAQKMKDEEEKGLEN